MKGQESFHMKVVSSAGTVAVQELFEPENLEIYFFSTNASMLGSSVFKTSIYNCISSSLFGSNILNGVSFWFKYFERGILLTKLTDNSFYHFFLSGYLNSVTDDNSSASASKAFLISMFPLNFLKNIPPLLIYRDDSYRMQSDIRNCVYSLNRICKQAICSSSSKFASSRSSFKNHAIDFAF